MFDLGSGRQFRSLSCQLVFQASAIADVAPARSRGYASPLPEEVWIGQATAKSLGKVNTWAATALPWDPARRSARRTLVMVRLDPAAGLDRGTS